MKGTFYYESGKIEDKGGFLGNVNHLRVEFHGKGKLYNEAGEVIQEGKWENGLFVK